MPAADVDRIAASYLTVGFLGRALNDDVKRLIDRGISGIILFSRNLEDRSQVAQLCADLKRYAGRPLLISVDQEGGLVQRLREGFLRVPPLRVLGESGSEVLAEGVGRVLGRQLRSCGIDVDFAPVLDVDTNPKNPVIGNRSLGADPGLVAALGVALGRGLEMAGVASCGKHFPGHGDTEQDSHLALPVLKHDLARLERVELVPFKAWCKAGLAALMSAHVVFEALDPARPATMSPGVLRDLLRGDLGFEGVLFSDDVEMKAICDNFGIQHTAVQGASAGIDNFLCCHTAGLAHQMIDALAIAIDSATLDPNEVAASRLRMEAFTAKWAQPPLFDTERSSDRKPEDDDPEGVIATLLPGDSLVGLPGGSDPTETHLPEHPPSESSRQSEQQ